MNKEVTRTRLIKGGHVTYGGTTWKGEGQMSEAVRKEVDGGKVENQDGGGR
jgi:hypothetical protein